MDTHYRLIMQYIQAIIVGDKKEKNKNENRMSNIKTKNDSEQKDSIGLIIDF